MDEHPHSTRLVLGLFWGSVLVSLTLPWLLLTLFELSAHRRTLSEAVAYLRLHFFAAGNQYFLVGLLSAAPFAVCAAFLLLHLGWNPHLSRAQYAGRLAGVVGSLTLMLGTSFWTHVSALLYPDAQAALAYSFLPYILLVLIPLGYAAGRVVFAFAGLLRPEHG